MEDVKDESLFAHAHYRPVTAVEPNGTVAGNQHGVAMDTTINSPVTKAPVFPANRRVVSHELSNKLNTETKI